MGHEGGHVFLIVFEINNIAQERVVGGAVGDALAAPVDRHGRIAARKEIRRGGSVFFDVFGASWENQDGAFEGVARPFLRRCPMCDTAFNAVGCCDPMGNAAFWTIGDVCEKRSVFHQLGQYASEFHRKAHVAVNLELASHERRCWVLFTVKDRLECIGGGGQCDVCVVFASAGAVCVDDDAAFAFNDEFCCAVKACAAHFCVELCDCFGDDFAHFNSFVFFCDRSPTGAGGLIRYIVTMIMLTHTFKYTVTALVVLVGLSLSAQAETIDELYDELAQSDAETYGPIEDKIVSQWEKSGSPSLDLLLRRGKDALDDGDAEAALEHFSALVDHDPSFAEGYNARATAFYALGMVGPALDDLRQALVLEPRHFSAMRGVGVILEAMERPEDALEVYQEVLRINPGSAGVVEAVDRLILELEGQAI